MLEPLSVSEFEERVYLALIERPDLSADVLADALGASPARVGRALKRLERLQLVQRRRGGAFIPRSPGAALGAAIDRRRAELSQLELGVEQLEKSFHQGSLEADPTGLVEVISPNSAVREYFREMMSNSRSEVLVFDRTRHPDVTAEIAAEAPVLARGVRVRGIYDATCLTIGDRLRTVRRLGALGEESRVYPRLPMRLVIYDRERALVPLTVTEEWTQSMIVVHRSGLLDALVTLFESYWERATPLPADGSPSGMDAGRGPLSRHAELLGLLSVGLKDEAIARHLGISKRTASRRINELLDELGASNRFQAGLQAAQRGWLRDQQSGGTVR